jgi:hypothetical protein
MGAEHKRGIIAENGFSRMIVLGSFYTTPSRDKAGEVILNPFSRCLGKEERKEDVG